MRISGRLARSAGVTTSGISASARRQDRHHLHVADDGRLEEPLVDRQTGDAEVDRILEHALGDLAGIAGRDREVEIGMLRPQLLENGHEQVGERRRPACEVHAAETAVLVAPHCGERLVGRIENGASVLDQLAPGVGCVGALAHALDERGVEAILELADLQAHRGLGEVEPARRRREAAQLDDFHESAQLVEIEAAHSELSPFPIEPGCLHHLGWQRCDQRHSAAPVTPRHRPSNRPKRGKPVIPKNCLSLAFEEQISPASTCGAIVPATRAVDRPSAGNANAPTILASRACPSDRRRPPNRRMEMVTFNNPRGIRYGASPNSDEQRVRTPIRPQRPRSRRRQGTRGRATRPAHRTIPIAGKNRPTFQGKRK